MNALLQMLVQQISGPTINKIANQLGIDPSVAAKAIGVAAPLLLSALTRNSSNPSGADSLHNALVKDHDGSIFDNLEGLINNVAGSSGGGILKHIFGEDQSNVTSRLSKTAGVDTDTMSQILQMMAPLVMGALGKTTREQNLDVSGMTDLLTGQQQEATTSQPNIFGSLNKMLDSDGDGNALNDIGNVLGKLFR